MSVAYSRPVGEIEERLATLEEQVRTLRRELVASHASVISRIDGGENVSWERSLRGRLHVLEGESAAAKAASRALAEAQRERRISRSDRVRVESLQNERVWRWVKTTIAVSAILAPYVSHALGHPWP